MANHVKRLFLDIKFLIVNDMADDLCSIEVSFACRQLEPEFLSFEGKWNIGHEELNDWFVV